MPACVVCGDEVSEDAERCERGHVTCDVCLCGLVVATLSADNVRASRGLMRCPWRGALGRGTAEMCTAPPWTLEELRPRLDVDTAGAVAQAAVAAITVAHEETVRLRAELAAGAGGEAAPVAPQLDGTRGERLDRWRQRFIESILTLKCPRCTTAFTDYDGCDSLTCSNTNCGAFFCALCLMPFDSGGKCHTHVAQARHHADGFVGLHGGAERFRRFHAIRRRGLIETRVTGVPEDETFRAELRRLLFRDAELEEGGEGADGGGGGGSGGGGGDGGGGGGGGDVIGGLIGLLDFAEAIVGDRGQQRSPMVKGIQSIIDLARILAGVGKVFTDVTTPVATAGGGGRPGPGHSTTSSVLMAASAGAVLGGGLAATYSAYINNPVIAQVAGAGPGRWEGGREGGPAGAAAGGGGGGGGTLADHPDAVALSVALGRPLTHAELQLSPQELSELRRAMLD